MDRTHRVHCIGAAWAIGALYAPAGATAAPADGGRNTAPLAPGVRIDWTAGAIELDAKVVLREGPLELIACSPQTREHESILVTTATPTRIFQAMGLVGLRPGSPVTYDESEKKWRAPTGEGLRISIGCAGGRPLVAAHQWVLDPKTKASPQSIPWVFAGSRTLPDGRFLAELDGTVICLVDFESALVTVAALHSADNTSLWLEANTNAIPPVGTSCWIRIESERKRIVATLGKDGKLSRANRPTTPARLAAELVARRNDDTLMIVCDPSVSDSQMEQIRRELVAAGAPASHLSIRRLPAAPSTGQ